MAKCRAVLAPVLGSIADLAAGCAMWAAAFLFIGTSVTSAYADAQSLGPGARLAKAEAIFQERCQKTGVFIHRTVENVDGLFVMKVRPESEPDSDQFAMYDPYGHDSTGLSYLKTFFSGFFMNRKPPPPGYRYVEAIDPKDGKRYRYTGSVKEVTRTTSVLMGGDGRTTFMAKEFVLDKIPAPGAPPRYGVTYDDISTREERELWIAGSSLRVIDLKTNEVIAERIGYMMDRGQGNRSGGRSPWLLAAAHACPEFPRHGFGQLEQTRNFVLSVLKPKLEQ